MEFVEVCKGNQRKELQNCNWRKASVSAQILQTVFLIGQTTLANEVVDRGPAAGHLSIASVQLESHIDKEVSVHYVEEHTQDEKAKHGA